MILIGDGFRCKGLGLCYVVPVSKVTQPTLISRAPQTHRCTKYFLQYLVLLLNPKSPKFPRSSPSLFSNLPLYIRTSLVSHQ